METFILALLKTLYEKALTPEAAIGGIIVLLLIYAKKKILPPIMEKLKTIEEKSVAKDEVEEIVQVKGRVEDTIIRLNKTLDKLDNVEEKTKDITRNTEELKRDLEQVKYILNQFQGHMMYGRRSSDFENQELK